MAYLRTAYNDGVGTTYLRVLIDGLGASSYQSLVIYNYTNGASYNASVAGSSSSGVWYSTTQSFGGLSAGRSYAFYAIAVTNGGTSVRIPSSGYTYFSTLTPSPPSSPSISTSVNGKSIVVYVTAGSNTETIYCTLGGNSKSLSATGGQTVSFYFTVPDYETTYSISAYGTNSAGSSSTTYSSVTSGSDNVPPSISIISHSGENNITVNWSASDDGELRSSNTFACWISDPDTTSLRFVKYVGLYDRTCTFTTDGLGNALKVNSIYLVRIIAYDSKSNSSYADRYVTFIRTRPDNFNWDVAKVQGGNFNITANEWNRLQNKVNEFRLYKGLAALTSLTDVTKDETFTAEHFNKIVRAVTTLSPSTSLPSQVSSGDTITASAINGLRASLNSVS